jgi:nucleotide-binding universal stress UspA family protein
MPALNQNRIAFSLTWRKSLPVEFDNSEYRDALEDFQSARRRAALEEAIARLGGKTSRMLQYDEVRKRLGGIESAKRQLKEIPLDSIVGTVGRYHDFNRKLLPLNQNDGDRWARVRKAMEDPLGLPPIEVYQVGEAYFILDGHHRASVAREFGASHIQAYVREVYTRVPLTPDDRIEDVILKSEYAEFLKTTNIDEILPEANLQVTVPGAYEKLVEHISVHRYFMGIDQNREIDYKEAVKHWYEKVYQPVEAIIRRRAILKDFPGRTEADLYLWIMDYRHSLENELGLKVSPNSVASNLITQYSPTFYNFLRRIASRLFDVISIEQLEPSPPPGEWRRARAGSPSEISGLFDNVLVTVTGDESGWRAVEQAISIAHNEKAVLNGLHVINKSTKEEDDRTEQLRSEFLKRCEMQGISSGFVVEFGPVTKTIFDRSFWSDLLVLRLSYPPPFFSFRRLGSGLRNLIRLTKTPLVVVPPTARLDFNRILLAYGGGPKSDEALYIGAYLAKRWNSELFVVSVRRGKHWGDALVEQARKYLVDHKVEKVRYIMETGAPADAILRVCNDLECDLILTGGYEGRYFRELIMGSTVDRILQKTSVSVMICH